jgi:hypothetical protein
MLESAKLAIDAMERLKRSSDAFTKTLIEIATPVDIGSWPNPYDDESFLDGSEDGEPR